MNRTPRRALLTLSTAVAAVGGCELSEVVLPSSEPVVVVQAIMRPDLNQQWVVVESSLTGDDPRQSTPGEIPIDRPQTPIADATVTIENLNSLLGDRCGSSVTFARDTQGRGIRPVDGLYWAPPGCPTMQPGDTLVLRVDALGVVVTGQTIVAGAQQMLLHQGDTTVVLPGPELEFNRDTDTLEAEIQPLFGRALQIDVRRRPLLASTRRLRVVSLFVDSTAVTIPGDLVDLFEPGTGDDVFRAGRFYDLSVAFTDQNYFDFVRSFNGDLSGRGFINHLDGGLGVFGSLVAETNPLRVIAELDDPREGTYRVQGMVGAIPVDVEWELYLARSIPDSTDFSAFVTGTWVGGPIDVSMDGYVTGDTLRAVLEYVGINPVTGGRVPGRRSVEGLLSQQSPFEVFVKNALGQVIATLTASR